MMRFLAAAFCFLLLITPLIGQSSLNFELVESIPLETSLDNPDIRNAPEVWIEMLGNAQKSIDLEEFYVSHLPGEALEPVISAIEAAAARGVTVRIIADSRMYKTYPETVDKLGKEKDITTRIIDFGKLAGGVQHAKFFLVDGEQIFLGSQNFDWRSLKHIHELGLRIRQPEAVRIYQEIFDLDWALAEKNDPSLIPSLLPRKEYRMPLTVINSPGDTITIMPTMSPKRLIPDTTLWDETNIVTLIDRAKKEVNCQVMTYSPLGRDKSYYAELDNAFRRAAARGVQVNLIVADWSKDHPTVDYLKSLALVPRITVRFSEIPEWSGGYVSFARVEHCKYLVIDSSACWVGTSNWEKSYFYTTRNLGVVVLNQKFSNRLREIFYKDWNGSYTKVIKSEVEYKQRKHGEN
jgi:phosphatidylserine/phosphatidylglycerophosphate/cardiolipin synthase-like enzyme